jgi:hypothetical protein
MMQQQITQTMNTLAEFAHVHPLLFLPCAALFAMAAYYVIMLWLSITLLISGIACIGASFIIENLIKYMGAASEWLERFNKTIKRRYVFGIGCVLAACVLAYLTQSPSH